MPTIVRKPHMNRVYVTGDMDPIRQLLSDFHARHDSAGYWLPLYQESKLRAALAAESQYGAARESERKAWESAKSVIPAEYRARHGAAFGGDVVLDGEVISEPSLDTSKLPWSRVACFETRCRDLVGGSLINGRAQSSETLYAATVADGRQIYRVSYSGSFGDDLRETYYLPEDLWCAMMAAEVRMRKITPDAAREWLDQYRGCVGTELYEFAAGQSISSVRLAGSLPASA